MLRPVITTACLCIAGAALGQGTKLSGNELRELFSGATVEIDAPLGYKIPVRYGVDGHVTGEAGGLASYLGAATDTGKWWVNGEKLCHKWKVWFSGELQCLRLSREGRTVYWSSQDGNSGTAAIVALAPPPPSARAETVVAAVLPAPAASEARIKATARPEPETRALPELPPPEPKPVRSGTIAPREAAPAPAEIAVPAAVAPVAVAQKPAAPGAKPRPPAAQPPKAPEAAYKVANIRNDDVLNVRSGPSAEHDVVAALQPGSRGVVITGDCQSEWCPVQHASASGWVNRSFLMNETGFVSAFPPQRGGAEIEPRSVTAVRARAGSGDSPEAPRSCLTAAARKLLDRVEARFGPMRLVSTCRPGATIAGTGRPSRHASGNAIDFNAGNRKAEIVSWLIANHREGGVMTYAGMDHIHIDVGPHFVSIAGGQQWASWRNNVPARGRGGDDADSDD